MPLIKSRSNTVKLKATVRQIDADGNVSESQVTLIARRVTETEFQEVIKKAPGELTKSVIVGWPEGEVLNADGSAVPFSEEALAELIDDPHVVRAISNEFVRTFITLPEKN